MTQLLINDPTAGLGFLGSGPPPLLYESIRLFSVADLRCSPHYTPFYQTSTEKFKNYHFFLALFPYKKSEVLLQDGVPEGGPCGFPQGLIINFTP
jgi:hypothetical protein